MALTLNPHLFPMALRPSGEYSMRNVPFLWRGESSVRMAFRQAITYYLLLKACSMSTGTYMCATGGYVCGSSCVGAGLPIPVERGARRGGRAALFCVTIPAIL
jgi:hypothetical protein